MLFALQWSPESGQGILMKYSYNILVLCDHGSIYAVKSSESMDFGGALL